MIQNIQKRVSAIRQQVELVQSGEAWGWTIVAMLGSALLAGILDAAFRLRSWPLRLLLTALVIGATTWAIRRWLIPWWQSSHSAVQVARRLEHLHPRLGERLSSALAFLQQETADAREGSLELRYAVIAEAEAIAADLPLEKSIDWRPLKRPLAIGIVLILFMLGLLLWQPTNFGRATVRLAWPFGGPAWPPRHRLALVAAPTAVALGEAFEVEVVDRNGRPPADTTITLEFEQPTHRRERHLLQQRGDKLVFRVEQVLQGFRYQVSGGDDDSLPEITLRVVQPPKLSDLVAELRPPTYSGLQTQRSGRLIKMLAGTQLRIEGQLDRAASAARLQGDGVDHLPKLLLAADRLSFHSAPDAAWSPAKSAHVWIELVDETGAVTGRDGPLEIQVIIDQPPAISWDQPSDQRAFTQQALVPIVATFKDDLAVKQVELRFAVIGSDPATPQTVVLFEQPQPKGRNFGEGESRPVSHAWDLSQLTFAEGAAVSIQLAARDFHDQETLSPPRRISLISPQDLQSRLVQRQGAILEQLSEVLRLQRQSRSLIGDIVTRQQDSGHWQAGDLDVLQSADLQQRQVQRLLKNPDDGLAKQIELLLAELTANRLGGEGIAGRMLSLQKQIRRVNDDVLPPLEESLAAALKAARLQAEQKDCGNDSPDCADEPGPLADVAERQDQAIAALEALLGELSQWDNFSRIAREVGLLKQEQQKLREQTESVRVALALAERDAEPLNLAKQAAQRQLETARQFDKLQQRMAALLAKLQDQDPVAAGSLAEAIEAAQRLAIGGQMRSAARQLQETRAGDAGVTQDVVLAGLTEVLHRLASRRDQDAKRQLAALNAAAGELNQLTTRGENLAREAAAAAASKDPQKRQLQRLTKDAQRLAAEVAELARKLERLQARTSAAAAKQAGQAIAQGGQAAGGGDGQTAEQQTKSALEDLNQAKKQLQQEIQKAQQDLVREELARLETELAGLLKRQQNLLAETIRLETAKQAANGKLSPAQLASLRSLTEEQRQLAEAVQASSAAFSSGEAFELALTGVRQAMQRAHRSLSRSQTDTPTQTAQEQAITRLKQLLAAARSQGQAPDDKQQNQPGGEQPEGDQPQVRSIGELQLLQTLQLEINRRTSELEAARPAGGEFTAEQQAELTELAAEQGRLAEIVLDLIQKPAPADDENQPMPQPPEGKPNEPKKPGNPLDEDLLKDLK